MTDTQFQKLQHPAFLAVAERRSAKVQLRVADTITAFAGSMRFVYLHGIVFAIWMLVFEKSPWPASALPQDSASPPKAEPRSFIAPPTCPGDG